MKGNGPLGLWYICTIVVTFFFWIEFDQWGLFNNNNNNNILYSSQRETVAVIRSYSYTLTHNEELNCTYQFKF